MSMRFLRLSTAAKLMTAPTAGHFVRRLQLLTPGERARVALCVEQEARKVVAEYRN